MIKLVKNFEEVNNAKKVVTHGGLFHADDVFATVLLEKIYCNIAVMRTYKAPEDNGILVYDIGGGKYDHHQKGGNGTRENGVPYSSFGLLWQSYGWMYLAMLGLNESNSTLVFNMFDNELVEGIDALDNGICNQENSVRIQSVSHIVSSFNPNWDDAKSPDDAFLEAVNFASTIFDNTLKGIISKIKAKGIVEEGIGLSEDGIMELDQFVPWQDHIFSSNNPDAEEIKFVVFPSLRGGYNVQAVPDAPGSFGQRKSLPESWAGLRDGELQEVTGVETAMFCHNGRFICGAETLEDALSLARLAVEN
jgi:uncharacterized UPF0160 family protein